MDEETFDLRLAEARTTKNEFVALIANTPFTVTPESIAWTSELDAILTTVPDRNAAWRLTIMLYGEPYDRIPFDGLTGDFLHHYEAKLRIHLEKLSGHITFTEPAVSVMLENLATELTEVSHRTLILALHTVRAEGVLQGYSPEDRYADYNDRILRDPAYRERLFTEYPLLGRELIRCGDNWLMHTVELLTRLNVDLPVIHAEGLLNTAEVTLTSVRGGLGDPHDDGRSVAHLMFDHGQSLIYKPRSVAAERVYADAIALLNERTCLGIDSMRVLSRPRHGWCEYLEHHPCADESGFGRFYLRIGAVLAVLHILGAVDIHMTNLIAVGDSPVPVDLETILQHSSVRGLGSANAHERAVDFLAHSVLATLILPLRTFGDGLAPGVDVSAVGGGAPSRTPKPIPVIVEPFTDTMRIIGAHREISPARNRPHTGGRTADPADHTAEIQRGFLLGYDAATADRERFAEILRSAEDIEVRYLARPTRRYDLFRLERFHPDYLRDARDTEQLLDKLWTAAVTRRDLVPIIESERQQLLRGDIPAFHSRPGSTALYSGNQPVAPDFFTEPSGQALHRKLALLGPDHQATQLAILIDALDTLAGSRTPAFSDTRADSTSNDLDLPGLTRAAIQEIADTALLGERDCTWIGIGTDGVRGAELSYQPLNTTLYDGLAGMSLLFGYAARHYQDDRFADLSRRASRPVTTELQARIRDNSVFRVGAFAGLAGTQYTLAHLHLLTGDPSIVELMEKSLPYLLTAVRQEDSADLVAGLAGCAVVAADLYNHYRFPLLLDIVDSCAERLSATALPTLGGIGWSRGAGQAPLGGFSHGSAGIGWALLKAAEVLGSDEAGVLGQQALAHDISLRIPGVDAWRDLRDFDDLTGIAQEHPTLWCHGSTGIGISRLLAYRMLADPVYLSEAEAALRATAAAGSLGNHCLCHGDSGGLELFTLATETLPAVQRWKLEHSQRADALVTSLAVTGPRFGRVSGSNIPGLLLGKAGVCLTLLRLLAPAGAPSVLWLEPPAWSRS
ncbi:MULTISPECIES: type 2 lanthipeptide synthetase LanM family protein [unclassified Crossiella]|uniref:type 2 lanthipeptide synthetase LanM family protein n=1 Tax=unclassified Crossiella TaxID=2620835 RepID=UPI001FFFE536|nr:MULTISPECIES: type 2 lanthipeptide synthetase LanM family protein [unclassified Crossiella]MCK2244320.1 type 2 lanthipeptide synthetase LanM family protein [Crossiella sp. S99.2]MCK2257852.1 type 2 lanthipeptide synthetase LanM family protein [Crossiella sp. S99.1]